MNYLKNNLNYISKGILLNKRYEQAFIEIKKQAKEFELKLNYY